MDVNKKFMLYVGLLLFSVSILFSLWNGRDVPIVIASMLVSLILMSLGYYATPWFINRNESLRDNKSGERKGDEVSEPKPHHDKPKVAKPPELKSVDFPEKEE